MVRPIPAIALVPVAILLFPTNEQGIVFITSTAAFFPILVSTRHAVRALPTVWEDALLTMGAGRRRVLSTVVLPGIVPGIFGGLSVGMGVAWICVISAEMISGDFGLGYRTWQAYTIVDYPHVLVGMLSIGAIGWLTSGCVELARPPAHPLARVRTEECLMTRPLTVRRPSPYAGTSRSATPARPVVENVDLDVTPGEILVVLGHSGCGKSTLLRAIAGLLTPLPARSSPTVGGSSVPAPTGPWSSRTTRCCPGAPPAATSSCRWRSRASAARNAAGGPTSGSSGSACPGTPTGCPASSPAACGSGCSWPAHWPASPA